MKKIPAKYHGIVVFRIRNKGNRLLIMFNKYGCLFLEFAFPHAQRETSCSAQIHPSINYLATWATFPLDRFPHIICASNINFDFRKLLTISLNYLSKIPLFLLLKFITRTKDFAKSSVHGKINKIFSLAILNHFSTLMTPATHHHSKKSKDQKSSSVVQNRRSVLAVQLFC
jgi:hypothetical protein